MTNEKSNDGKFQDAVNNLLSLDNEAVNEVLDLIESLKRDFYAVYNKCPENIYTLWFIPNFGVDQKKE